jgi:hypothetical protein
MRISKLAPLCLLISGAPAAPVGKIQTWLAFKKAPIEFASGGVTVRAEALPCPAQSMSDSTCRWEGCNNQAA